MNKITTFGRLAADPQLTTTNNGQQACKFRVASQNTHRQEDNTFGTNWYNCTAWGKTGEMISRSFRKGMRINISGDLVIRDYTDKNGASRTSVDIRVDSFDYVETQAEAAQYQTQQPVIQQRPAAPQVQYGAATTTPAVLQYQAPAMQVPQPQQVYQAPAQAQPQQFVQPQVPAFTPIETSDLPF